MVYRREFPGSLLHHERRVSGNTVTITDENDANAETPIYLGGGDWGTTVSGNTLNGNGASGAAGVNLNSDFYASGTGVTITSNTISGFLYGIHVRSGAYGTPPPAGNTPSYSQLARQGENIERVRDRGQPRTLRNHLQQQGLAAGPTIASMPADLAPGHLELTTTGPATLAQRAHRRAFAVNRVANCRSERAPAQAGALSWLPKRALQRSTGLGSMWVVLDP